MDIDFKHCDDYIDDAAAPACLRAFLARARQPAHGHLSDTPFPKLFATYNGPNWNDVATGDRVRVVMASRMGDVGVTKKLDSEHGYSVRCAVGDLIDLSEVP
jgi:hypothetical protein